MHFGLRANKADALDRLVACLPTGWKEATSPFVDMVYSVIGGGAGDRPNVRLFHLVYAGGARILRTLEWEHVVAFMENELHLYVADTARQRLFVHAGVVGWQGRAVLIPGVSRTGKTTLVAALLRAGATYYSDEYALLDRRGRVHPFPRPLSVRVGPDEPQRRIDPEALGAQTGTGPLPVGLVLVTRYRPGARWRPRPLTPGQAALALLANTVSARSHAAEAMTRLQEVATQAPTWEGTRGEADQVPAWLPASWEGDGLPPLACPPRGSKAFPERMTTTDGCLVPATP